MSDLYLEDPGEGTLKTYNKKVIYNHDTAANNKEYANLVDFNFGEKFFYGKIQRNFVPMYFDNLAIGLKAINSQTTQGSSHSAMSFVADAFEKLAQQFSKGIASGKIYANEEFLSSLKVFKSFASPIEAYNQHLNSFTDTLVERLKQDESIEIQNFNDFLRYFRDFILKSSSEIPFTFSAYLKSKYCPMTVSGLVIEIADLDYFNDEVKINKFYNSRNWEYYINACRSYGFMVDKDIPWRLVADIASPSMLQYASVYNFGQTDLILNSGFARPDMFFMQSFRRYLLNVYNRVIKNEVAKMKSCKNGLIVEYIKTERYTIDEISGILNDTKMLKLFFDIRFAEDPKDFTKEKKDGIIRKCLQIYSSSVMLSKSVGVFEKIINQPFDYNGSVSYLYNQHLKGVGVKIVLSKPG